jgi:hypothetical protein
MNASFGGLRVWDDGSLSMASVSLLTWITKSERATSGQGEGLEYRL